MTSPLQSVPLEIIDHILGLAEPEAISSVSQASRCLHAYVQGNGHNPDPDLTFARRDVIHKLGPDVVYIAFRIKVMLRGELLDRLLPKFFDCIECGLE